VACCEVRERHAVGAADFGIHVVNLACETVWRKPLGNCVSVQERSIDAFRIGAEHAVKSDGASGHGRFAFQFTVPRVPGCALHGSVG